MKLQQLKETSSVKISPWYDNNYHMSNNVTKRGIVEVDDNDTVERVWFNYFSNYIGEVKIIKWFPGTNEEIEEYFTKYLAMAISMDQEIENDPEKIEALKVLFGLDGTLYIEDNKIVFRFKDLGVISPIEDGGWYLCPNGADNVVYKTLAEAVKAMVEHKASLEAKPTLLKNII
jgi:hypothetical protein